MLVAHHILSTHCVPIQDDLHMRSRECLLIKPRAQNRYKNWQLQWQKHRSALILVDIDSEMTCLKGNHVLILAP